MLCNLQIFFEFSNHLSSFDYQFNSTVLWEYALYDICSLSLLKCVLWPRYGLSWSIIHVSLRNAYMLLLCLFSRSVVSDSATPWTAARQASLSIPSSRVCSNSHPLSQWCHPAISSSSSPAFNLSQHQGLFQWISSSHQVAKVLELRLQHQSFQWIFKVDFLLDRLVGSPCSPRDLQEPSPTPQLEDISSSVFSLFLWSSSYICTWLLEKP